MCMHVHVLVVKYVYYSYSMNYTLTELHTPILCMCSALFMTAKYPHSIICQVQTSLLSHKALTCIHVTERSMPVSCKDL